MTFNKIIFQIMEEKGIKPIELAKTLGVTTSTVSTWKTKGTDPPVKYLARISELLNTDIYDLLGITYQKSEVEVLYNRLSADDKAVVDLIFSKYKGVSDDTKSSDLKIG